jgi:hypothetical protein
MHNTLLPIIPGPNMPLSSLPPATYDEQLGTTFTQNFPSIAYNVTAVSQADSYGYGPAYLLNGLSNDGYWYQVGLSFDWPYATGGYNQGFSVIYEVFNSAGNSIYGPGLLSFSSPVNSGDLVLLSLYSNNGIVYMYAEDWNSGAVEYTSYADSQTSYFAGSVSSFYNSNGFFTGLMTEWYHVNPYSGDESQVTYSDSLALSSAWMWMDEWEPGNRNWSGTWSAYTPGPVTYSSNPTQLHSLSSHGATEYSSAYEFITGSIVSQMTSITLLPAGGSTPLSSTNEFAVSFTSGGQQQITYAQNGTLTFTADSGTNAVISGVSNGSGILNGTSPTEEWVLNSQGASVTVTAGSTATLYYYDLLSQPVAYVVLGSGNISPMLTYYTAPSTSSSQSNPTVTAMSLPYFWQQVIWTLRGTIVSVSNNILGTAQDQWATPISSWSISQANQIYYDIGYYHQYQVTAAYSTSDDSVPSSNITLSGTQFGSSYQLPLTTTNQTIWLDENTAWLTSGAVYAGSAVERWVSSAGTSGNVTSAITINPTFAHQYYLTVASAYGSSSGSGWYDSGSAAYAGLSAGTVAGSTGTQYVFSSWSGAASGSNYAQSNALTMNSPETATANWNTQYQLMITSNSGSVNPASGWFNAGSSITIYAVSPSVVPGEQYVWNGWTGSGTGSYTGAGNNTALVTMNAPVTETASWTHQYYLTVSSVYGSASGQGWYNAGSSAPLGVATPFSGGTGMQYVLSAWSGSGSGSYSGSLSSTSITMNNPITETASWITQYYLFVSGGNGPSGAGWYNSGSTATAYSNWIWNTVSGQSRYALTNWQLDGTNQNPTRSNTGNLTTSSITMSTYHTVAFVSTTQYYLTVDGGNGVSYGTPSQTSDNWYDSGTSTTVSSNWVWNVTTGQSRTAITNWQLDNVNQNPTTQGSGTLTTSNVTMTTYHTVNFVSTTQYMVSVASPYGSPSPSTEWFDAGADVTFSVSSPVPESIITQHVCTGWTGTGSAPATGTQASLRFTINQPSSITWNWQSQLILPRILLLAGAPSAAAVIIGLSIYLLRRRQILRKRK